jgi:hypothetical protein
MKTTDDSFLEELRNAVYSFFATASDEEIDARLEEAKIGVHEELDLPTIDQLRPQRIKRSRQGT